MKDAIEFVIYGKVPNVKDRYRLGYSGGKMRMFKDRQLAALLDSLAVQIPAELRNLHLKHPDLDVTFIVPMDNARDRPSRSDRDGMLTTILDILVRMGVIRDDSISVFNGTIILRPAQVGKDYKTIIRIQPSDRELELFPPEGC